MLPVGVLKRIIPYIYDSDECINYHSVGTEGYGCVHTTVNGKHVYYRTHRAVYEFIHNVELKRDELILHSCDNPSCMNIKHLRIGTDRDNSNDKVERGRAAKGEKNAAYKHGFRTKEAVLERLKRREERGLPDASKATISQIKEIKKLLGYKNMTSISISKFVGVHAQTVYKIKAGRSFKNISI